MSASASIKPEEDQHLRPADVVVRIPPIRVTDVVEAVGAAAVVGIGQTNGGRAIRSGESEGTGGVVRGQKRPNLVASKSSSKILRAGFFEKKAAGRWRRIGHANLSVDNGRSKSKKRHVKHERILRRGLTFVENQAVSAGTEPSLRQPRRETRHLERKERSHHPGKFRSGTQLPRRH